MAPGPANSQDLPRPVAAFLESPLPVDGKLNGQSLTGAQLVAALKNLGPLELLGHLARSATDISVTWRTQNGITGATRFTLDSDGTIQAVAVRWAGL